MFVPPRLYTEDQAREAAAASLSHTETLRRLGVCHSGGAAFVLKRWLGIWRIPTDHFDPYASQRGVRRTTRPRTPLKDILIVDSTYDRSHLKLRLFEEGLKERICECCGQGELWQGAPISLILDHVNGIRDDNRLENLRIMCPNCNASLDTHCGRNARLEHFRRCLTCGREFRVRRSRQRYCSRDCGIRYERVAGAPRPRTRRAERPPLEELLAAVEQEGYLAVGRRYGVSDNAIRKWIMAAGAQPPRKHRPPSTSQSAA